MNSFSSFHITDVVSERASWFLRSVYGWMFVGLAVTALTAAAIASSSALVQTLALNPVLLWAIVIVELVLVFVLSSRVDRLRPAAAAGLFILYSALTGVTTSIVLLVYTSISIVNAFVITSGMFGAMALFGSITKRSLASAGQFLFMGLIGLVLASVVSLFWLQDALQFLISVLGVVIFTGLTAWDAQRLRRMADSLTLEGMGSYAVAGALALYLDFINLFFSLLWLTGKRRDDWR
jgi:FtsH-binding integral membrane protein